MPILLVTERADQAGLLHAGEAGQCAAPSGHPHARNVSTSLPSAGSPPHEPHVVYHWTSGSSWRRRRRLPARPRCPCRAPVEEPHNAPCCCLPEHPLPGPPPRPFYLAHLPGRSVQGGDLTIRDGTGWESINGERFPLVPVVCRWGVVCTAGAEGGRWRGVRAVGRRGGGGGLQEILNCSCAAHVKNISYIQYEADDDTKAYGRRGRRHLLITLGTLRAFMCYPNL